MVTMDKTRILPGELLVSKGTLKINSSLPEVGLKDVSPNGSWLEQKQIQAALEARKQLIAVERIEKSGVLSHAEWCEELMLAEVTQKVGGYWQYLGHNVGKRLFLRPEEALFLMEVNCLLLKYNEVKVSLQQAYALLLRSKISLMQYKVYASLSRVGYRVFRHNAQPESKYTKFEKENAACSSEETTNSVIPENISTVHENKSISTFAEVIKVQEVDISNNNDNLIEKDHTASKAPSSETDLKKPADSENVNRPVAPEQASTSGISKKQEMKQNKKKTSKYIQCKINILKNRKFKTKNCNINDNYFENIPEFTKNSVVNVTAPDRRYLPGKINFKNNSYCLNVEKIRTKPTTPEEFSTTSSSPSDSTNAVYQNNANRLRNLPNPNSYRGNNWTEYFNFRFSSQPPPFRNFNFWRPQANLNYFQFNMTFQRPFQYPQFGPRVMLNPFLQPFMMPNFGENLPINSNNNASKRKRARDLLKNEHYAAIERLANLVKNSILELRLSDHNVSKLNNLIQSYNTRYRTRLRISDNFTVITDENIVDTIEVDDDEAHTAKKPKKDEVPVLFDEKLQKLKQLAFQLKNLEFKNEANSRHRRMFSNLMRGFNKSYNVDYYVNDNFDVINRNDLTILSSSDSEGAAEISSAPITRKKLKNPFSILKKLSEKQSHKENRGCTKTSTTSFRYSDITVNTFKKEWLPDKSDFGRAEIVSKDFASEIIDTRREQFLFDFMKIQPDKFKNWLDVKISFLQCLQETCELSQYDEGQKHTGIKSLVKPEEFNDAALVLKKLSIFENHKVTNGDGNLVIDFDVYNRNIQNFKKSNRPLPHFRVICLRESSSLPSGDEVASLHSKYKDNVTIIFAVVGIGSVSYLQVDPTDLPVYVSSNANTV